MVWWDVFFTAILLEIAGIDYHKRKIPNVLLCFLFFLIGLRALVENGMHDFLWNLKDAFLLVLPLLALTLILEKRTKRKLLGGGDLKLLFLITLYLGGTRSLWALWIACVALLLWAWHKGERTQPFSPGLVIGVIFVFLLGR